MQQESQDFDTRLQEPERHEVDDEHNGLDSDLNDLTDNVTLPYITITPSVEKFLDNFPTISASTQRPHRNEYATLTIEGRQVIMTTPGVLKRTSTLASQAKNLSDMVVSIEPRFRANNLSDPLTRPSSVERGQFMEAGKAFHAAMASTTGTVWIVNERNAFVDQANFDRPGALLCCYLVREVAEMNWSLAIRTIGSVIYHAGKHFDPTCCFTRAIMAFELEMYDFKEAAQLRDIPVSHIEKAKLKPTAFDIVAEQETLTDTQEDNFDEDAIGADPAWVKEMLKMPVEQRQKMLNNLGINDVRKESAGTIVPGEQSRCRRADTEEPLHPNSLDRQQQRDARCEGEITLEHLINNSEKICMNFGKDDGYWADGELVEVAGGNLKFEFGAFTDGQELDRSEMIKEFAAGNNWRVGALAKDLNKSMHLVAESVKIALRAAAEANFLANAAENVATKFKAGDICQVPCPHIANTTQVAVVKHVEAARLEVILKRDEQLCVLEGRHQLQVCRLSATALGSLGFHKIQHPQRRTKKLAKAEMWACATCAAENEYQVHTHTHTSPHPTPSSQTSIPYNLLSCIYIRLFCPMFFTLFTSFALFAPFSSFSLPPHQ